MNMRQAAVLTISDRGSRGEREDKSGSVVQEILREAGFTARVFRDDDGLFKVRVGQFRTRREAQQLLTQIRSRVGGSPFVVAEQ